MLDTLDQFKDKVKKYYYQSVFDHGSDLSCKLFPKKKDIDLAVKISEMYWGTEDLVFEYEKLQQELIDTKEEYKKKIESMRPEVLLLYEDIRELRKSQPKNKKYEDMAETIDNLCEFSGLQLTWEMPNE